MNTCKKDMLLHQTGAVFNALKDSSVERIGEFPVTEKEANGFRAPPMDAACLRVRPKPQMVDCQHDSLMRTRADLRPSVQNARNRSNTDPGIAGNIAMARNWEPRLMF